MRLKQRHQRRALVAALPGQLDAREELRAGVADIGRGGRKLRFLPPDIRTLRQQLRRQARRHPRRRNLIERTAGDVHAFRRPRYQRRQRVDVLRQRLPQRRHQRPLIGEHAFLLRDVEVGACAGFEALLDSLEDARCAGDIAFGGAYSVLRGEHLEIGVGDGGQRGQRHHVAIETVRDGRLLRRLRGLAVLAPKIELIAGAQRSRIVDDLASAIGQSAGARARRPGVSLLAGAAEARQQRRARDTRLRVRLNEACRGRRDVQIDRLGFLHQDSQFARTKPAPPVQCWRRVRGRGQPRGLVARGNVERRIGQILGQNAAGRTGDHAKCRKPPRRAIQARDARQRAIDGNSRVSACHIHPPPGVTPGIRPCENRQTDSRNALVGTACETFTGVMLPLVPDCHTTRGIMARTALLPVPRPAMPLN